MHYDDMKDADVERNPVAEAITAAIKEREKLIEERQASDQSYAERINRIESNLLRARNEIGRHIDTDGEEMP